jgi:photosystem II stability/assembly factor-like uncharacterized protein
VDFEAIAATPNGEVWVGGSSLLKKGMLLRSRGTEVETSTTSTVSMIDDLCFNALDTGWLLSYGSLYKSEDRAASWRKVNIGDDSLNSLFFANQASGWLAGKNGSIYHTVDGGVSWNKQDSGTEVDLNKVLFIDGLHGWVIGKKASGMPPSMEWESVLIRTQDGGQNWETLSTDELILLDDISFIDIYQGWGLDSKNNIVHTDDGGKTWSVQHPAGKDIWSSIFFINEREGWVVGDGILHTDDGGKTWVYQMRRTKPEESRIKALTFTDDLHGWIIRTSELLYTSDGGITWQVLYK